MNTVIKDVVAFFKHIGTIVVTYVTHLFAKYKFKNGVMLAISLWFFFGMHGGLWTHLGFATLYIWIGINIEQILAIYRELKEKNGW